MKIFVISHKPIAVDLGEPFEPLYVGQAGSSTTGLNDRAGISISDKNPFYSELTAQYWVWKNILPISNLDQFIGFCHYRRFFSYGFLVKKLVDLQKINHYQEISQLLNTGDVVLPTKSTFPLKQHWYSRSKALGKLKLPWQSLTLFEQFELEHNKEDLLTAISLLPEVHRNDFTNYLNTTSLSAYNMYIAKPPALEGYFATLFPWLFELEKILDLENRDAYQARLPGFIAERFASYYFNKYHNPVLTEVSFIG